MGSFNYAHSGLPVMRKCIDCKNITPFSDGGNDLLCLECWDLEGLRMQEELDEDIALTRDSKLEKHGE